MKVAITVPVLDNLRYVRHLLDSIHSRDHELQLNLIDNGSTDGATEYLERYAARHLGVHFEHHDQPLGVARAWNRGLELAASQAADLVYTVNTDIVLHPRAIDNLVDFHRRNEFVIVSSLNLTQIDPRLWQYFGHYEAFSEDVIFDLTCTLQDAEPPEPAIGKVCHPDFCAFMADPRELLDEIGPFGEEFVGAYFEDKDMAWRIYESGRDMSATPSSLIVHFHSRGIAEAGYANENFLRNRQIFMQKFGTDTDSLDVAFERGASRRAERV